MNGFLSTLIAQIIEVALALLILAFIVIAVFIPELYDYIINQLGTTLPIILLIGIYIFITTDKLKKNIRSKKAEIDDISGDTYSYKELIVSKTDEMKIDLLAITSAVLIVFVAKIMNNKLDYPDIVQAFIAFGAVYATKSLLFQRRTDDI